jgi:nucleotide-binding universal stress UspA family protein
MKLQILYEAAQLSPEKWLDLTVKYLDADKGRNTLPIATFLKTNLKGYTSWPMPEQVSFIREFRAKLIELDQQTKVELEARKERAAQAAAAHKAGKEERAKKQERVEQGDPRQAILALLKKYNAELIRDGKHKIYRIPGKGTISIANTPSDYRTPLNDLSDLRKMLGEDAVALMAILENLGLVSHTTWTLHS